MRRIGRGGLRSDVQPLRQDGSRGGTRVRAPARGYGIEGSQMANLIRVEEGRGGVDRVEAIAASELGELVLRALIEMDEGDDMCRSIAVAGVLPLQGQP